MKPCPHCGKEIQDSAVKCRWCLQYLSADARTHTKFQRLLQFMKSHRLILLLSVGIIMASIAGYSSLKKSYNTVMSPLVWKVEAMLGNANAQYNLGHMFFMGEGVPTDIARAIEWWQKAAAQGNANAQFDLGMGYSMGAGVLKDSAKAAEWFQKAAAQGNTAAQYNIGLMYYLGDGVPKDLVKAAEWFQKAAAQGNTDAQYNLGFMYRKGEGVSKDSAKAVEWYQKAAEQGNVDAQHRLDVMKTIGDEILCAVKSMYYEEVGRPNTIQRWNTHIRNLQAFIQRENGTLTLIFDYNLKNRPPPYMRFLVRLFDKNGQYITHFTTKEYYFTAKQNTFNRYTPNPFGKIRLERIHNDGGNLKSKENVLQYPVNMRDASHIEAVEFGIW